MAVPTGFAGMLLDYALPSYDSDGYLYGTRGEVVDVTEPEAPRRAGLFPYSGAVWPVPDSDAAVMISPGAINPAPLQLRLLDAGTFTQLASRAIGDPSQTFTEVSHLVHAEPGSLAFIARRDRDPQRVYVLHDPDLLEVPSPEPEVVSPIAHDTLLEIPLQAQSLVADPVRQRLYAIVNASAETYPNRLVTLDPQTGLVLHDVHVGSEPRWLALSEDASTLWVALHGSHEVRRVDLTTGAPVPGDAFEVPRTNWGEMPMMTAMVVLGGTTDSVAVLRHHLDRSPSSAGVVVIDAGVGRPMQAPGYSGLLSSGPPGYLFSAGGNGGFAVMALDASGISSLEAHSDLVAGTAQGIAYDPDGFVYATTGQVVDVRDPTAPIAAGAFSFAGTVWPQPEGDLALMVSGVDSSGSAVATLRVLDTSTFSEVGALPLPDLGSSAVFVRDLIYVAPSTVAFIAGSGARRSIYLLTGFAFP